MSLSDTIPLFSTPHYQSITLGFCLIAATAFLAAHFIFLRILSFICKYIPF